MTGRDNRSAHFNLFCAENLVSVEFLCILVKEDKPVEAVFTLMLVHHVLLFSIETKAAFKKGGQFGDSK